MIPVKGAEFDVGHADRHIGAARDFRDGFQGIMFQPGDHGFTLVHHDCVLFCGAGNLRAFRITQTDGENNNAFLSGEEISRSLGMTRQALWKHIEKLRDMGYSIEAVPHLGYKLLSVPDKIVVSEVKWKLKTEVIGRHIHYFESVGSTNNIAYKMAEEGAPEGTVVIANEQTKGKGRLGRVWDSPADTGVYLSCILRPNIAPNEVPEITLVTAVSVVKAIRKFSGVQALIKWPNDILISDKKSGGILTELKAETDKINFVILGIGININTVASELPGGATSVKKETKSSTDLSRVEFVKILLTELENEYAKFREKGFSSIRNDWKSLSCTIGRYVSVSTGEEKKFNGKAIDVDAKGALIVKSDSGEERTFLSGDVTLIR